jgi:outer membrane receptor protein involved in Fe transport
MRLISRSFSASASAFAIAVAAWPAAASAQQDSTEQCNSPADAAAREECVRKATDSAAPAGQTSEPTDVESPAGIENTGDTLPPAQGSAPDDAIVVTGSRIPRPNFGTVEPAVVISSEDIETRGFETLGQALNELPAFGVPGSSPVGGQSSFGPGQSFVNFLGLGDQRTLTLVNGNRFVSSNTSSLFGPTGSGSQVDLNLIPTALIDRVETIAVGGAPVYGSDAIAGTINIILKRNFTGLQLDGQSSITQYGDIPSHRFRVLAGKDFAGGRANVTFAGEYNKQGGAVYTDRALLARGEFYDTPSDPNSPNQFQLFQNQRFPILSEFGIPLRSNFYPLDPTVNANREDLARNFGLDLSKPADAAYVDYLISYLPGPNFSQADVYCGLYGLCSNFTDAQGRALRFDATGNLVPIDFGTRPGPDPIAIQFATSGGNGLNLDRVANLLTPLERYSTVGLFSYEFSENLRFSGEAWYTHSAGRNLVDQPAYNSAAFGGAGQPGGNLIIRADNPFLSQQARTILQAQAPQLAALGGARGFYLARANTDISTREAEGQVDVFRFVGNLEGSFEVGGRDWGWELTGNYGRSRTKGRNPEIIEQNFNNAVDAVLDANGNIVCRPGYTNSPFPTGTATCAPLNLFGANQASPEALDYITGFSEPRSLNTQKVGTATLNGQLFDLPGGPLAFAVGYEHREETFNFDPGALLRGGPDTDPTEDSDGDGDPTNDPTSFTRDAAITGVKGRFNTDEAYAEFNAPIVSPNNSIPFVRLLEVKGAFRWVDHSTAGADPAWTVGGRYAPMRDITFRGNYTRSIRSPAVGEIALPVSPGFFFATDPCSANNRDNGPNPTVRQANCTAAGIPANFIARAGEQSTFAGVTVGNPDLENERATAWSVGAVITPSFIPGLSLSVDYVDVKLKNAISFFGASQVLASCYDSPDFPNNQFCARFKRETAAGPDKNQLTFVETSFFNADLLEYQGILADLDYRVRTPFLGADAKMGFGISAQYLDKLESSSGGGEPVISRGEIGYPKYSAVGSVSYTNDGLLLQVSANYTSSVRISINDPIETYPDPTIAANVFVNAAMAYDIGKRFSFRIAVDNILGKDFPSPGPAAGGVTTYFPAVLGTLYRVGATVKF